MTAGTLSATQLTQGLPAADRAHEHRRPVDQRRPPAQPEGAGGGREGRRRARRRDRPRPAARHPGARQGQPRRRRPAHHRGLGRAREQRPGQGLDRSSPSCAPRARSCSASSTCPSSRTSSPTAPCRAATARSAGRCSTPTTRTSRRAAPRAAAGRSRRPAWPRSRSARETSGSITSPANDQGVVGLRPDVGLVSRTGILPISATQDTAGPMTRTVADAAAELAAIAGKDPEDPATATAPDTVPDYLAGLKPDALAGKRIGVINNTNAQYGRRSRPSRRSARPRCRSPRRPRPAAPRSCSRSSSATWRPTSAACPRTRR